MNSDSTRPVTDVPYSPSRRHFFRDCGIGVGKIALASMITGKGIAAYSTNPTASKPTHFPPTAKRVIYLFMAGAPSQLELFDHKPKLIELEGKPIPPEVIKGQRYAFIQPDAAVLGASFQVRQTWRMRRRSIRSVATSVEGSGRHRNRAFGSY